MVEDEVKNSKVIMGLREKCKAAQRCHSLRFLQLLIVREKKNTKGEKKGS